MKIKDYYNSIMGDYYNSVMKRWEVYLTIIVILLVLKLMGWFK